MTTTNTRNDATPGFAIRLEEDTDLGMAMLIAEDEDGGYWPVGPASTIAEARELAAKDLARRKQELERGGQPACPAVYKVWARTGSPKTMVSYDLSDCYNHRSAPHTGRTSNHSQHQKHVTRTNLSHYPY